METIYIKLNNENIDVWRPVLATFIPEKKGYYIELPPLNSIPSSEEWEFLPGMIVTVTEKISGTEVIKVAVSQIT